MAINKLAAPVTPMGVKEKINELVNAANNAPNDVVKISLSADSGTLKSADLTTLKSIPQNVVFERSGYYYFAENLSSSSVWYYSCNVYYSGTQIIKRVLSITTSTGAYSKTDYTYTPPTYTLPLSASGTRGGIQIGYTASGANIPVQLSSEKAYVALTKTAVTTALGYTPPTTNTTYSAATSSALGLVKIGYTASGANIPVQLSSEKAYVALTKTAVTSALGYTPPNGSFVPLAGGTMSDGASLKFSTYGTRFITITGNNISADMSNETGGWAGNFASVKDPAGDTTSMLGWYGNGSGLIHIYMGGTYSDPYMKMTKTGQFTFKNTPLVGTTAVALATNATTSAAGLMSASDKSKLDGIASGANAYSLPLSASGTRGGIQIGYTASGANIPVQLSSEKAYVALTKTAVTSALGYTPPNGSFLPLSGGQMTGKMSFKDEAALPSKSLSYVCGIDAFASGGQMGWQAGSGFIQNNITSLYKTYTVKSALGWESSSVDANKIPNINTLAYWNGAYQGTSSNLTYCSSGEIASKSYCSSTYATKSQLLICTYSNGTLTITAP